MAPRQEPAHGGGRHVVPPEVAWVGRHLGARAGRPLRRVGTTDLLDADTAVGRQQARRLGRPQRILDVAQVADHRDHRRLARPARTRQGPGRLMDDAEPCAQPLRHDAPGKVVQGDQPISQRHRAKRRDRIDVDVVIDVGAAQLQDYRARGVGRLEFLDRRRAPPGVHGHHQVGGLPVIIRCHTHAMAEVPQDACPARSGDAVAGT